MGAWEKEGKETGKSALAYVAGKAQELEMSLQAIVRCL
jgi:hypothetical protein